MYIFYMIIAAILGFGAGYQVCLYNNTWEKIINGKSDSDN